MRRISKTKPPKNVSPDDRTPRSLQEAERALKKLLVGAKNPVKRARDYFDALSKPKLRKVLYEEQRYLCVYCERRFRDEEKLSQADIPRIDHWRPLSSFLNQVCIWSNLYLSCASPETCDTSKGCLKLELPWPTEVPYEDWIGFTSGGVAYVRIDASIPEATRRALEFAIGRPDPDDGSKKHPSILHLNHPSLVAARKAAIDKEMERMKRDFRGRHATPEDRQARAAALLDAARYPAFVSTRVAYLQRMLGKHRNPA